FWPGAEPVKEYAEKSPVKDSIKFIGFVNNAVLPDLYRDATLYIFPSLFEGFGLSLVEAMACGVPAACSNNSSLAEVGGDAVITFDPENPDDIAFAMNKMLSSRPLREDMINRGLLRAKDFDWNEHASKLVEMYEKRT
ncbi:MAG: glycosyltransferase, partial [Victivallaceae bacterium]